MSIIRNFLFATAAVSMAAVATPSIAKMVGGAQMYPEKNIVENAVNSQDHTTLVAAVKAAGLVDTLQGEGPYTVFAPVNAAFEKLPDGTVEALLQPDQKDQLIAVLTYHVVPGDMSAKAIVEKAASMGGKAEFKTVQGETLTAMVDGDAVKIMDQQGHTAMVTIADVNQSNGVIHVIDTVLLP